MLLCKNCGHNVESGDLFCGVCGHKMIVDENICIECKNTIQPEDVFCQHCGVQLTALNNVVLPIHEEEPICPTCKIPIQAQDKFCQNCGATLLPKNNPQQFVQTITPINIENPPTTKVETVIKEKKFIWIIVGVLLAVILVVAGGIIFTPKDSPKTAMTESTTPEKSPVPNAFPPPVVPAKKQGSILGNDVILRSHPSITGRELDYLQKGAVVDILEKNVCDDQNAAVINVDNKYVTYNGQTIHLARGQAAEIQSFDGARYYCKIKLSNNWVYGDLYPGDIRKIYGDVWYQVQLYNGKTGWVYGDYVLPI